MPNRIILKKGTVAGTAPLPADLEAGELAVNTADGALFTKLENGTVYTIMPASTSALSILRGGTGLTTAPSALQLLVGQAGGTYALRTITAGANVSIVESGGTLTISSSAGGGGGDVTGAASSTANALVRFDGTTGKIIKNSGAILDDSNNLTGVAGLTATTVTAIAAATQDAVRLQGRAGGTGSWVASITPTTLTANRTLTLADGDTTLIAGTMVNTSRSITIAGTTNQIISSAGAQSLAANRTWTLSLPQDIHTGASPTFAAVTATTFTGSLVGNASTVTDGVYTTGSYANPTWITSLAWSKISTTPTTLAGYGITDAQPLDADLTSIAALGFTATAFLKKTAANTWSLDTNTYLTGNQTITLTGGATGSGTTSIAVTLTNASVTGQALTGYAVGTNTALAAADTILAAFQKVQGQLNARLTANQTITLSGDVSGSGATAITATLATVNSNVGSFGSATAVATFTVNGKGLITAAGSTTISGLTTSNLSASAGITNAQLANSSVTVGTTAISLGASSTTLVGLTSVTSTGFTGALTGNASTATTLQTSRTLWGKTFNGSANVTGTLIVDATNAEANYLAIQRNASTAEEVRHYVGDSSYDIKYTNDEAASALNLRFINTDTEAGGGVSASSHVVAFNAGLAGVNLVMPGTSTITATTFSGALSGNATTATSLQNSRTIWGQSFNGSANVTGNLTAVGNITGTAGVTLTATGATLGLAATGAFGIQFSTNGALRGQWLSDGTLRAEVALDVHAAAGGSKVMNLRDSSGTVDAREWSFRISGGVLELRSVADSNTTQTTVMSFARAGGVTIGTGGIFVTGNSTITGTLSGITTLTATTLSGALAFGNLTYSGLTTGTVLRATGATAASFGALDLTLTASTSGALRVDRGGTGLASYTTGNYLYASGATTLAQRTPTQVRSDISAEFQQTLGVPRMNLGDPTVRELALFDGQYDNKVERFPLANFWCETSTDGVTWSDASPTQNQKERLVGGDANNSSLSIPHGTAYYRVRFRANTYVYLNAIYAYMSTQGNSTQVQVFRKHDNDANWTAVANSTTTVNSWPGHMFLPHATIPFNPTATQGTHHHEVYVVFIPTWSHASNPILLYKLQWWGGYPAARRNVYSTDEFGNVVFPANVTGTTFVGALTGNASTAATLQTGRLINGVSFNGSANISVPDLRGTNGTTTLATTGVTSGVNWVTIQNAITGSAAGPIISTAGTDTNIPLTISTKGTGAIIIDTGTGAGQIDLKPGTSHTRFWDDDSSHYWELITGNVAANYSVTLPAGNVALVAGTMVPTIGTGATGTWGISISGNAATATTAGNVTGTVAIANGGTGATAAPAARTNLGATTVGSNLFTLTNPSAITFLRVNADNTVSALNATDFRTAIGAGTSSTTGTVTSVSGTGTVSGLTLSGTVTTSGNLTLGGTLSVTASNFASQTAATFLAAPNGAAGVPTFRAIVAADIPTLNQSTTGSAGSVTNAITFNNGGAGAASGTTYNGSVARTISYNTIGAAAAGQTMHIGTTAVAINRASATQTLTGVSIDGNAATATTATTANALNTANAYTVTSLKSIWYYFDDLQRDANNAVYAPNAVTRGVRWAFVNASSVGTGGNYAGMLQFNPWAGTTASTGDASYQMAFGSTTSNGGGVPHLRIRKGIDTTWNAWVDIMTSSGGTFNGSVDIAWITNYMGINNNDTSFYLRGWNSGQSLIRTNAGFSSTYNGLRIDSNADNSNSLSNWIVDIGGIDSAARSGTSDTFNIARRPSGGSFTTMFLINSSGVMSGASIVLGTDPGGSNLVRAASARITSLGVGMNASGTTGRIDASGDIVAASTSDLRLKDELGPITGALAVLEKLSAIRYQWKQDDFSKAIHGYGDEPELGVIAQEVEQFFPELVQTRENGYKAVRYERMVPVLIAAIKELRAEVKALKGEE
jgi:hypothetical protein